MYEEQDPFRDFQQILIEDEALDLKADLKVMMSLYGPNVYDENVDLLSIRKIFSWPHQRWIFNKYKGEYQTSSTANH